MIKIWKLTLFFLFCLTIALLFNLPVQHLMQWLKLPPTIQVSGIDGTFISGKAREITINQFPVRDLRYRYMPSCIPLLKVCYQIQYDRGEIQLAYDLLNGDAEISNTQINYAVPELMAYVPNQLIKPAGKLELSIKELSYLEGKPANVSGTLIWRDLGLDDGGIKVNIGDYQVDFNGDNTHYDFVIKSLDASLDVKGDGEIKPGGLYKIDIRINGESGIDTNVKTVLDLVAANAGYNKYRVERSGRLPPHITRQIFK
jgi:hypothetical protein